jgi:hypothetical protein
MPSASSLKRRFVRIGSPSPANMRVGSSFSRLNANTPPVNGKWPGRFSSINQRSVSPGSANFGSEILRIVVPESVVTVSAVRISRSRTFTTCSSPEYAATVCGHASSSAFSRSPSCASRSAISASICSPVVAVAFASAAFVTLASSLTLDANMRRVSVSCQRSRASCDCATTRCRYTRTVSAISLRYRTRAGGTMACRPLE